MWTWTIPRLYIIFHGICEYSCASPTLTRAGFRFTPPSGVLSLCFGGTFLLFSSGYSRIFVLPSELQNHLQTLSMEQTPLYFRWGCITFMHETEDHWLLYNAKQSFMERWIFCKSVFMCLKRVSGFYLMGFSHFLLSVRPNIFMLLLPLWMEFAVMFPPWSLIAYGLFVYANVIVTALLNAFIVCVFFLISWSFHNIMSSAFL